MADTEPLLSFQLASLLMVACQNPALRKPQGLHQANIGRPSQMLYALNVLLQLPAMHKRAAIIVTIAALVWSRASGKSGLERMPYCL